jgi:hypothetical protein
MRMYFVFIKSLAAGNLSPLLRINLPLLPAFNRRKPALGVRASLPETEYSLWSVRRRGYYPHKAYSVPLRRALLSSTQPIA